MDAVQELVEMEALKRLKARYFYFMDTKQWDAWLSLWAPDATLEWDTAVSTRGRDGQTQARIHGVDELRRLVVEPRLDPATTVHQGHTPILEIISDTDARGIWAMEDIVVSANAGADGLPVSGFNQTWGHGHYHETYRKIDGEWRFASVHLTRLRIAYTME
jgi:SnoaL-like domain